MSQEKVVYCNLLSLHQIVMLPFSLFGALAKFQFLMDKILHLQSAYAIAYLNNIISYSNDHPKFLEMGGSHIKGKEVCSWKG